MTAQKTLAEKLAAERANAYRIARVKQQFLAEYDVTTDEEGNYIAAKKKGRKG